MQTEDDFNIPYPPGEICHTLHVFPGSSVDKESACSAGDLVRSLGQEDPLEEGMEPTPVSQPGESPWTGEPE